MKSNIMRICVFVLPVIILFIPEKWITAQSSICLIKYLTGYDCLGCGITRAIISLLKLEIEKAILYNGMVILVFPILTFKWIRYIYSSVFKKCSFR